MNFRNWKKDLLNVAADILLSAAGVWAFIYMFVIWG